MEYRERVRKYVPAARDVNRRLKKEGFTYPFGAYPEKEFVQQAGYDSKYIKEGKYFYYQIAVSHERLMPALETLLGLLPARSFFVVQIHTDDYFKDCDTYISEDLIGTQDIVRWIRKWQDVALDDGFFGIGAFIEAPTAEVFLDEHKTIHVYHNDPDMMEKTLESMDIPFVMDLKLFWDEPHYHEPLPLVNDNSDDYLTAFEYLADRYDLLLDEDEEENIDGHGEPVGMTCWKVEIRGYRDTALDTERPKGFYSTLYLNADSRGEAIDLVESYMETNGEHADLYLQMARLPEELLTSDLRRENPDPYDPLVWFESERVEFSWDQPRT